MNIILQRKYEIIRLLNAIDSYPSTGLFKHEMMTYAYVLVCGAIEFMTENILEEWLNKTIQHHGKSTNYKGKKYIKYFLSIQSKARYGNIEKFTSTKLEQIKGLITQVAGDSATNKFKLLLTQVPQPTTIQLDANARLERINRFRHDLAHGQKMPLNTQPNITELKEDFLFVYENIIRNIKNCLPRV
jgi:hypothetical protein